MNWHTSPLRWLGWLPGFHHGHFRSHCSSSHARTYLSCQQHPSIHPPRSELSVKLGKAQNKSSLSDTIPHKHQRSIVNRPNNTAMVLQGFSYSKLTELQVQGAQDRSRRQIEVSQLKNRLENMKRKWKTALREGKNDYHGDDDQQADESKPFREAISQVYEEDPLAPEISPIMTTRLAELCRQEFRCEKHKQALEYAENQQQESLDYTRKEIEQHRKEKLEVEENLQQKIQTTKNAINDMKRRQEEERNTDMKWKKEELLKLKETIVSRIEELEKKDWSQIQEPVMIKKCGSLDADEGREWIELDEDYFPATGGTGGSDGPSSGWVLCS